MAISSTRRTLYLCTVAALTTSCAIPVPALPTGAAISGDVVSAPERGIQGANVYLVNDDGTFLCYAMTDATGSYSLDNVRHGKYRVVSFTFGFEDGKGELFLIDNTTVRLPVLTLTPSAADLAIGHDVPVIHPTMEKDCSAKLLPSRWQWAGQARIRAVTSSVRQHLASARLKEISQRWQQGLIAPTDAILGVSVLWLGRVGKILQLLAGLTLIAEIVGATRLRSFGASLRSVITMRRLWLLFTSLLAFGRDLFRAFFGKAGQEAARDRLANSPVLAYAPMTTLCVVLALLILSEDEAALVIGIPAVFVFLGFRWLLRLPSWGDVATKFPRLPLWAAIIAAAALVYWIFGPIGLLAWTIGVSITAMFCWMIAVVMTPIAVLIGCVLGALLDVLLVEPLAKLVEASALDRQVKLVSLGLLFCGFCLEMLAS